jgi:hypothetical protein
VLRLIENFRLAKAPTTEAMALDMLDSCCCGCADGGFAEILAIQVVKCRKNEDVSVQTQQSQGGRFVEPVSAETQVKEAKTREPLLWPLR